MPRSRPCRASTTGSAWRSLRRPRGSWPTTTRAIRTSAARSCARCSERERGRETMSRIGRKPVAVPQGVTASVEGQKVKVKGPKGALEVVLHAELTPRMETGSIVVAPRAETNRARAMWGLSRSLVNNLVTGVTKGFEKRLEISGVGYRAAVQGKN